MTLHINYYICSGLWAVVNCAEAYLVAEIDWCSVDDFHNIHNVNYLGVVRVTKALLHLIRKARGRIINLSSLSGKLIQYHIELIEYICKK